MEVLLPLIYVLFVARSIVGECIVDSPTETKYIKYLDPLKSKTVTVQDKKYKYTIRFCDAIEGTKDVGVSQKELTGNKTEVYVGKITATDIKVGTDWMLVTYKNGKQYGTHCGLEQRQAHLMMLCDTKNLLNKPMIVEENNFKARDCSYIFEINTSAACIVSPVSPISGLSIGSVIVIITVCLVAGYIILGFIFQRYFIGAKGIEQFPNLSFWRDFGNLVADGCVLVFRTQPAKESRSYKGLGDDQLGFDEDEERDDHMLPM